MKGTPFWVATFQRPAFVQLGLLLLLLPISLFLLFFFFIPAVNLLSYAVLTQDSRGIVGRPFTLEHFQRLVDVDLYARVLLTTLRVSVLTCIVTTVIAYPVAIAIVQAPRGISRTISLIVIAPLVVSVIVRAYGWQLILLSGEAGALNWTLIRLGLISAPLQLLYRELAVVIGQVHVNLPMMVLPLAAAIGRIDPNLPDAARTLGAPWWQVFLRVTLPLSVPGLAAGLVIVFSLTAGAFVTPMVLGGPSSMMLGNLIEQQIFAVFNWPFGAAIACVLVFIVLMANFTMMRLIEGRLYRKAAE